MSQATSASGSEDQKLKRAGLTAAGGTLLLLGLKRRTMPGYAAALAGGWLAYRGIRGGEGRQIELVSLEDAEASAEAIEAARTLTIDASPEEVHAFLAEPANLDALLGEAGSVERLGEDLQRWTLNTPLGGALSWEMQPIEEPEEETGEEPPGREPASPPSAQPVLGWESVQDEGSLRVEMTTEPASEGEATELTLQVAFAPPGGALGKAVLDRLDVVPHAIVGKSLRRAKALIETGEVPPLSPGGMRAQSR